MERVCKNCKYFDRYIEEYRITKDPILCNDWGSYESVRKERILTDPSYSEKFGVNKLGDHGTCDMWENGDYLEEDNKLCPGRDAYVGINFGCIHFEKK